MQRGARTGLGVSYPGRLEETKVGCTQGVSSQAEGTPGSARQGHYFCTGLAEVQPAGACLSTAPFSRAGGLALVVPGLRAPSICPARFPALANARPDCSRRVAFPRCSEHHLPDLLPLPRPGLMLRVKPFSAEP